MLTTADLATPATSFRLLLQSELARRCARNPQYSMRAFAMHLDIDHATLSQWLRGLRPITARTVETLGPRLGLQAPAVAAYVEHAGRPRPAPAGGQEPLSGDTAELLGDWYHFAILELLRLDAFQADSRWIARVLDISVDEVNVALQRLIRLDLLEMVEADRWLDKAGDAAVALDALGPAAMERRQEQSHRLSMAARRSVPIRMRDHSSTTLCVNSAMLPRAFELIGRFRQQLAELLQEGSERDDVYQIELAFFPVTTFKRGDGPSGPSGKEQSEWDAR